MAVGGHGVAEGDRPEGLERVVHLEGQRRRRRPRAGRGGRRRRGRRPTGRAGSRCPSAPCRWPGRCRSAPGTRAGPGRAGPAGPTRVTGAARSAWPRRRSGGRGSSGSVEARPDAPVGVELPAQLEGEQAVDVSASARWAGQPSSRTRRGPRTGTAMGTPPASATAAVVLVAGDVEPGTVGIGGASRGRPRRTSSPAPARRPRRPLRRWRARAGARRRSRDGPYPVSMFTAGTSPAATVRSTPAANGSHATCPSGANGSSTADIPVTPDPVARAGCVRTPSAHASEVGGDHGVERRLAVGEAADLLDERARRPCDQLGRPATGQVRRHHAAREVQQRVAGRQRLGVGDVEHGGEPARRAPPATRASWSTSEPRAVFTRVAPSIIRASCGPADHALGLGQGGGVEAHDVARWPSSSSSSTRPRPAGTASVRRGRGRLTTTSRR